MPKPIRPASALLVAVLAALGPVRGTPAQPACDGNLSRLPLLIGADEAWVGTLEGEMYRLSNITDANAIETIYVDPRPCQAGNLDISVEVKIVDAPQALGGLIYARVPEPLSYLTLVLRGDDTVRLYSRGPKGLEELARFGKAHLLPGDFNTLRILESPGQFDIYVNGERVGTARTDLAGTGAVGILAGGKGEFLFRHFTVAPAAMAEGAQPPEAGPEPAAEAAPTASAQPPATGSEAPAEAEPAPGTPVDLPLPPLRPPL